MIPRTQSSTAHCYTRQLALLVAVSFLHTVDIMHGLSCSCSRRSKSSAVMAYKGQCRVGRYHSPKLPVPVPPVLPSRTFHCLGRRRSRVPASSHIGPAMSNHGFRSSTTSDLLPDLDQLRVQNEVEARSTISGSWSLSIFRQCSRATSPGPRTRSIFHTYALNRG